MKSMALIFFLVCFSVAQATNTEVHSAADLSDNLGGVFNSKRNAFFGKIEGLNFDRAFCTKQHGSDKVGLPCRIYGTLQLEKEERNQLLLTFGADGFDTRPLTRRERVCFNLNSDRFPEITDSSVREKMLSDRSVRNCLKPESPRVLHWKEADCLRDISPGVETKYPRDPLSTEAPEYWDHWAEIQSCRWSRRLSKDEGRCYAKVLQTSKYDIPIRVPRMTYNKGFQRNRRKISKCLETLPPLRYQEPANGFGPVPGLDTSIPHDSLVILPGHRSGHR